jgi:hypothetical protein
MEVFCRVLDARIPRKKSSSLRRNRATGHVRLRSVVGNVALAIVAWYGIELAMKLF